MLQRELAPRNRPSGSRCAAGSQQVISPSRVARPASSPGAEKAGGGRPWRVWPRAHPLQAPGEASERVQPQEGRHWDLQQGTGKVTPGRQPIWAWHQLLRPGLGCPLLIIFLAVLATYSSQLGGQFLRMGDGMRPSPRQHRDLPWSLLDQPSHTPHTCPHPSITLRLSEALSCPPLSTFPLKPKFIPPVNPVLIPQESNDLLLTPKQNPQLPPALTCLACPTPPFSHISSSKRPH